MKALTRRLERWPTIAQDGVLALVLAAVEVSLLWVYTAEMLGLDVYPGPTPVAVVAILAMTAPIAWRRRAPLVVLGVTLCVGLISMALEVPTNLFGPLVAFYTVAAHCSRRRSLVVLAGVAVLTAVLIVAVLDGGGDDLVIQLIVLATAWLLGDAHRARGEHAALLAERAEQLAVEREQSAELAVAEERARVARELHDVVAHTLSVMVVQSAAARRVLPTDTDRARAATRQVVDTGRQTLQELRRLLGILHVGEAAELAPQPGLDDLDELIGQFTGTAMRVRVRTTGTPRALAPGVDLSAYRIVQESLTNALKHSGARRVDVHLDYGPEALAVTVTDDGAGPVDPAPAGGHGLIGMRERAGLVGGSIVAGPGPDGGFQVSAVLPAQQMEATA